MAFGVFMEGDVSGCTERALCGRGLAVCLEPELYGTGGRMRAAMSLMWAGVAALVMGCSSTGPVEEVATLRLAAASPVPAPGVTISAELTNISARTLYTTSCYGLRLEQRVGLRWEPRAAPICPANVLAGSSPLLPGETKVFARYIDAAVTAGTYRLVMPVSTSGTGGGVIEVIAGLRVGD